jgi:hypothetical protein
VLTLPTWLPQFEAPGHSYFLNPCFPSDSHYYFRHCFITLFHQPVFIWNPLSFLTHPLVLILW